MTKEEARKYFEELASKSGLTDDQKAAVAAALGNETFGKAIEDGFMLNADYTKGKQALTAEQRTIQEKYANDYKVLQAWAAQHQVTVEQAQRITGEYQKYRDTYGVLDGNQQQQQNGHSTGLTADEVRKLLEEREQSIFGRTATVLKDVQHVSSQHFKRFKEPLDVDAFDEFVGIARKADPNISIRAAYEQYAAPKLEEMREAEMAAKLKAAREEGRKEAMSQHRIPIDSGSKELGPAWTDKPDLAKLTPNQQEDHSYKSFMDAWNEEAAAQQAQNQ